MESNKDDRECRVADARRVGNEIPSVLVVHGSRYNPSRGGDVFSLAFRE
jgi:hypothetical protein